MRCFVITKKHIILIVLVAIAIPLGILLFRGEEEPKAVSAFAELDSEEIISEVVPSDKNILEKVADYVKEKKEPTSILKSFSAVFSDAEPSEAPSVAPIPITEVSQTPTPTEAPIEEKRIASDTEIKNETGYAINIVDFENSPLDFLGEPNVLILHTHTTECYSKADGSNRSINSDENMISIGEIVSYYLTSFGINNAHDTTFHDYPSYKGAYGRSLATAKKNISANSKINIILDIHRDAIIKADGTNVKLTADINGKKCAQVMLVCGTDAGGLAHIEWRKNLIFAAKLQKKANELYPGLMRPINIRKERFNQHLALGAIIIEVGTNGNSLEEAKNSAELIADVIIKTIK